MTPSKREEIKKVAEKAFREIEKACITCMADKCRNKGIKIIKQSILTQVAKARKEALEEAAKIADKHWATKFPQSGFARASKDIASEIRNQNKLNQQGE